MLLIFVPAFLTAEVHLLTYTFLELFCCGASLAFVVLFDGFLVWDWMYVKEWGIVFVEVEQQYVGDVVVLGILNIVVLFKSVQLVGWGWALFYKISLLILDDISQVIELYVRYQYRLPCWFQWLKLNNPIRHHNPLYPINHTRNCIKPRHQDLEQSQPKHIPIFYHCYFQSKIG